MISIDTCRADYLSCYGYKQQTTPNIDLVAEKGFLFENVISPVALTLPAHSTMLTGTIPPYHGVHDNLEYRLGDSNVTVAEILKSESYITGAVISSFVLDSQFGLDSGFDSYNDKFEEEHKAGHISERKGSKTSHFALEWLDEHAREDFFLFLHYYDPHTDYEPPEPFASKFPKSPYAGEIAYTDHCIGQVIKKLKELDIYNSTLLIIAGDHGEMLDEHGEANHGYYIYQSAVKVPLVFKLPRQTQAKRIKNIVGLVDIAPTIYSLSGINIPSYVQGISLTEYFDNKNAGSTQRQIFCESLTPTKYNANTLLGIVTDRYKYIQTTRPELYDLAQDPEEKRNLVKLEPNRARILRDKLSEILEHSVRTENTDSEAELDSDTRSRLESLGYVSGSIEESFDFDQTKDDPKDLIDFHKSAGHINYLLEQEKKDEAKDACQKLLKERPQVVHIRLSLARILAEEGNNPAAIDHLNKALEYDPDDFAAHNNLGMAFGQLDEVDKAIMHFKKALELKPQRPKVFNNLGFSYLKQGKLDEAVSNFKQALKLDPKMDNAHKNLAKAVARKGLLDEAVEHFNKSLDLNPAQPEALGSLANVYSNLGRVEQAVKCYESALELEPDRIGELNNLAWIKATTEKKNLRDSQKAIELAQRACELTDYKNVEFLDTLAVAYAAAGEFSEAITTTQKALDLIDPAEEKVIAEIKSHLELYKVNQPYRPPSQP